MPIRLFREARRYTRPEAVIAVRKPMQPNVRGQHIILHLFGRTKWIARSLADQRRRLQVYEMRHTPGGDGLSWRMEWVAKANKTPYRQLVCQETCGSATERLTANNQIPCTQALDHRFPCLQ